MDLERERERERETFHRVKWSLRRLITAASCCVDIISMQSARQMKDHKGPRLSVISNTCDAFTHTPFVSQFIHFIQVVQLFKTNRKIKWLFLLLLVVLFTARF